MRGMETLAGRQARPGTAALHGSLDGRLSRDPRRAADGGGPRGGWRVLPVARPAPDGGHVEAAHPSSAGRPWVDAEQAPASCRRTADRPVPDAERAPASRRRTVESPEPDEGTTARCGEPPAGRHAVPRAISVAEAARRGAAA